MSEPLADRLKASVPGPSAPVDPARLWRLARRRRVAKRGGVAGVLAAGIAVVIAVMPPSLPQDDIVFEATPQQPAQAAAGAGSAGGRTNEPAGTDGQREPSVYAPQSRAEIRYAADEERLIACIEDAGLPVQRSLEGFGPYAQPQLEEGVVHAVSIACRERLEAELRLIEELRRRHRMLAEAVRCLQSAGVDVSDPPALDVFLDNPTWSPYDDAGVAAGFEPDEARRIREACPDPVLEPLHWMPGGSLD